MARGWESKSVEDQVNQAHEADTKGTKTQLTPSQAESRREKEVLLLSRARVEHQLETAQNPRYREQLTRALGDIDARIKSLFPEAASAMDDDSRQGHGDA
jgi:hypothetical protein